MTKKDKINLLKAIAAGGASIEDLEPPIKYLIFDDHGVEHKFTVCEQRLNPNPTLYLSPEQYEQWKTKFDEKNKIRKEPHTIQVLQMSHSPECVILYHCQQLPNCLHGCGCKWNENAMTGNH